MGTPVSKFNLTNPSAQLIFSSTINKRMMPNSNQEDSSNLAIEEQRHISNSSNDQQLQPYDSYDRLKYIDDSSADTAIAATPTEKELLLMDNDSGNASISDADQHSHQDEELDHSSSTTSDDYHQQQKQQQLPNIKLRKHCSTFSFNTLNLTNRFSSMNLFNNNNSNNSNRRYSTQNFLLSRSFESIVMKKSMLKASSGDLIEIRCACNCQRTGVQHFMRASIHHKHDRQQFRRSLHRQSFHHHHHQTPPMIVHHHRHSTNLMMRPTSATKQRNSFSRNFSQFFLVGRSCVCGSMDDLSGRFPIHIPNNTSNTESSKLLFSGTMLHKSHNQSSDYCSEQFHYVYVDRVDNQHRPPLIWCFHVKPFQRMGLLDDDRNVGIIRHEPLDLLLNQIMFETEERHWQCSSRYGFRQPKLSVHCQIRNQEKFSRTILRQTLNASPQVDRIRDVLFRSKDCYVRYNKTVLNSEHYVTLWKYGIGWSTWANNRADILRTLRNFVERFSRLVIILDDDPHHCRHQTTSSSSSSMKMIQLQGGECLSLDQSNTNLIVQCFGLQDFKVEQSIQQWIQWQVVIGNIKKHQPQTTTQPISGEDIEQQEVRQSQNKKNKQEIKPQVIEKNEVDNDNDHNKSISKNNLSSNV